MSPKIYPLSGCGYLCLHFAQSTPRYRYRVRSPPPHPPSTRTRPCQGCVCWVWKRDRVWEQASVWQHFLTVNRNKVVLDLCIFCLQLSNNRTLFYHGLKSLGWVNSIRICFLNLFTLIFISVYPEQLLLILCFSFLPDFDIPYGIV